MKKLILSFVALALVGGLNAQTSERISNSINLGPLLQKAYLEKTKEAKEEKPVVVVQEAPAEEAVAEIVLNSDVDKNIPVVDFKNENAIAVVIGNAIYENTTNVDYAVHDARAVKMYLESAMGFLPENIMMLENATLREFNQVFGNARSHQGRLNNLAYGLGESEVDIFVFYAGHGAPDPNTKSGYFLPSDSDPNFIDITSYPAEQLFSNLSKIGAKSTTVVLDACFSGNGVITGLSAVAIKPKDFGELPRGVIMSSSSGTQPSAWYEDKNHGLFTYHFLKALQDEKTDVNGDGQLTITEVFDYVDNWVPRKARMLRNLDQTPTIRGEARNQVLISRASPEVIEDTTSENPENQGDGQ